MKRDSIRKYFSRKKTGQVWIETVIYTLIAFVMIGLVISYVKPKIEELQDKAVIEQSAQMMKQIDSTILIMGGAGNKRILEIGIKKGTLRIDGTNDKIIFEMQSKYTYSEPGKTINEGDIKVYTQKKGAENIVNLTRDFSNDYNIKVLGKDEIKTISQASTSYQLSIINEGLDVNKKVILNMSVD